MMAVVLSGAILIEQKGSQIKFKEKCEKCGWISSSTVTMGAPSKNSISSSYFLCPKCKNNQKRAIQGT